MLILGHRGASADHPENTVESFVAAREQGADGVELDVRRTLDGRLAVHHDATLADGRPVAATAAADLPPTVPLLAAALDACEGLAVVNVEVKNLPTEPDFDPSEQVVDDVLEVLDAHPRGHGGVLVSSFHRPTIDRVKALAPRIRTGWLAFHVPDPLELLARAAAAGHDAVHPHVAFVTPALVEAAHRSGLEVVTWTVDDAARLRELAAAGVDAAITNAPGVARVALRSA